METNLKLESMESSAVSEYIFMTKNRITKNLLKLSLGFFFLFSAFMGLENLQSTMNNVDNVGVASQSAIYGSSIISSLFLPKLLIKRFGCKLTLVVSMLTYLPYIAANIYPTISTLFPAAILLGTGAATLWVSANTYINKLSFMDAKGSAAKALLSTSKFFGIFQVFFQGAVIWGSLVSFFVLSPSRITSEIDKNISATVSQVEPIKNISCGAEFCGGIDHALSPLPYSKRLTLIGIYFAFSIIAAAFLLFFLDCLEQKIAETNDSSFFQKLAATFNHMKETQHLLLLVLNVFSGLGQGFVVADYSEAYVACAMGLQNVGLVFVCFGITNAVTAFLTGRLLKYVPRTAMMMAAAASNVGVCIALIYWKPNIEEVSVFYILISFWGFSSAIWQTQLSALYGVLFRKNEEAAFANFWIWKAVGFLIAYICSGYLCMLSKIFMQIGFLVVGMAGYITLEISIFKKK